MTATPPKPQTAPAADDNPPTDDAREKAAKTSLSPIEWSVLVDQIKAGEDFGMEQLYKLFSRGIRYYLCRQLGPQELEDKVNDTFLIRGERDQAGRPAGTGTPDGFRQDRSTQASGCLH